MKNGEYPVEFVALDKTTSDMIASIDIATYPDYMNHWQDIDVFDEALISASVERYSFLARGSTWLGFCIAFLEPSNTTKASNQETSLYVCDMVVLPGAQKRGYGTLMALEVMRRATDDGIDVINFSAREKTTYQILLGSEVVERVLKDSGYQLINRNEMISYPDDGSDPLERGHLFSLVRTS